MFKLNLAVIIVFAVTVSEFALMRGGSAAEAAAGSVQGIIAEHCVECHRVPGFLESERSPEIGAPDFLDIATDRKTYSAARLKAFLREPHFPMRRLTLSERDIDNILAFIFALKDRPEID